MRVHAGFVMPEAVSPLKPRIYIARYRNSQLGNSQQKSKPSSQSARKKACKPPKRLPLRLCFCFSRFPTLHTWRFDRSRCCFTDRNCKGSHRHATVGACSSRWPTLQQLPHVCLLGLNSMSWPSWYHRSRCRVSVVIEAHTWLCVAFQLRVSVAVLLELTELAKPVERPCLCCNTRGSPYQPCW